MTRTVILSKKPVVEVKKVPLAERRKKLLTYFNQAPDKVASQMMKKVLFKTFTYLLLAFGCLITIFPFYWMTISSLNRPEVMQAGQPLYWGCDFQFQNFSIAWSLKYYKTIASTSGIAYELADGPTSIFPTGTTLGTYFTNSLIVTIINTVLTVATTLFAAFAISKLKFAGRKNIFTLLLMTMMIPGEMLTVQNIVTMTVLGWTDTYMGIVAPFITSTFYIFLLVQLFQGIPDSLYKAARVDGCGDWKFLWRVLVPMSKNTLATISILNAISTWNSYLWPSLIIVNNKKLTVLAVGLYDYTNLVTGQGNQQYPGPNLTMAAAVIAIFPMVIVYLLLRKQILAGVSRSGTKG